MNVARLNMSHGDHTSHQKTIDLVKEYNAQFEDKVVSIMLDTKVCRLQKIGILIFVWLFYYIMPSLRFDVKIERQQRKGCFERLIISSLSAEVYEIAYFAIIAYLFMNIPFKIAKFGIIFLFKYELGMHDDSACPYILSDICKNFIIVNITI